MQPLRRCLLVAVFHCGNPLPTLHVGSAGQLGVFLAGSEETSFDLGLYMEILRQLRTMLQPRRNRCETNAQSVCAA